MDAGCLHGWNARRGYAGITENVVLRDHWGEV